jgi:sugar lactone lactonase YvrE
VGSWTSHRVALSFGPRGACCLPDGRVLVGTVDDNKVYRLELSPSLHMVREEVFLEDGPTMALRAPLYVACSDTLVAVSCRYSDCVHVLDQARHVLYTVGEPGVRGAGQGGLNQPEGVCLDEAGRLYVVDWRNQRVVVCGAGGRVIHEVRTDREPYSVTYRQGRLYVGLSRGSIVTYRLEKLQ